MTTTTQQTPPTLPPQHARAGPSWLKLLVVVAAGLALLAVIGVAIGLAACGSSASPQPETPVSVARSLIGSIAANGTEAGQEVVNACADNSSIVTLSDGIRGIEAFLQFTDGTIQVVNITINPNGSLNWAIVPGVIWDGYPGPPAGWSTGNCALPSTENTQPAAAPPPAPTPTPVPVRPTFDCYVGQNPPLGGQIYQVSINIHPGTGVGYSQAVVKVTVFDEQGHVIQTKIVIASSATSDTWQVVIPSLATESSCTAVVESAS